MGKLFLADSPAMVIQRFKITTRIGNREFTTIETGRGRAFKVSEDYEEALLNAGYNAMYKHVNKPLGRSNPRIVPYGKARVIYEAPIQEGIRVRYNEQTERYTFRDMHGRFTKKPTGRYITQEELKESF